VYVTDRLLRRRVHPGQATRANVAAGHSLRDRATLYQRHFDPVRYDRNEVRRVRANLIVRAAYDGARAARHRRLAVVSEAACQCVSFRTSPWAILDRAVELARWVNTDAR